MTKLCQKLFHEDQEGGERVFEYFSFLQTSLPSRFPIFENGTELLELMWMRNKLETPCGNGNYFYHLHLKN